MLGLIKFLPPIYALLLFLHIGKIVKKERRRPTLNNTKNFIIK